MMNSQTKRIAPLARMVVGGLIYSLLAVMAFGDGLIASPEPGWPQWRGPHRDGISDEKGLMPSWPADGPNLLWKVDGLGVGWSSPIVVGQHLYITGDVDDDLVIFAFDTKGTLRWQMKNGKAWTGSYPGARASCAFSEGRIYHLNAHGRLVCLNANSGDALWSTHILERFEARNITWGLSECLLIDGSRVFVTPGGKKALIAALDKQSGRTVWTTEALGEDRTSHSSPLLLQYGERRIMAQCSSEHGFAVDADSGELLWTVPLKNRFGVNTATPVYGSGSLFFVTPYGEKGRLYRLLPENPKQPVSSVEHRWTSPINSVTGGALLVDDILYAAGYRSSKWWFAIDWKTGQTKFEQKQFTTGAAICADRRLYVLDERGAVGLLKPSSDGLEVVGQFDLPGKPKRDTWAHPVLLDGRLYIRYHDTLWCYDVLESRL